MALAIGLLPGLTAQETRFRPPPAYVSGGKADQAEGAQILRDFRSAGIAGTYWLAFELRVMPREGEERSLRGDLFGTHGERGPLTRLNLGEQHWVIQSGREPAAWQWLDGRALPLPPDQLFQPIAGTDLTVFDLQMPFLYWPDFVYEGVAKVRGRPAHSFVLYPPAALAAARPGLTGVRVLLDTQFQALVQAEVLGAKGATETSITVLDLKKVGTQWLVKSIDLRNHLTRAKTRFTVTAAALDLALDPGVFDPERAGSRPPVVPPEKIQQL